MNTFSATELLLSLMTMNGQEAKHIVRSSTAIVAMDTQLLLKSLKKKGEKEHRNS